MEFVALEQSDARPWTFVVEASFVATGSVEDRNFELRFGEHAEYVRRVSPGKSLLALLLGGRSYTSPLSALGNGIQSKDLTLWRETHEKTHWKRERESLVHSLELFT